ncbi:Multifunctional methyltransferase subunit TRM112-like protein [Diplonema papillatum]|nr:Multifunctional methyltransferase subunit TRM112-like protein [Diplonema papillatum]
MKGLTHNLLACLKCTGYPLRLVVKEADQLECEFEQEHIVRLMPKLDWDGLVALSEDMKEFLDAEAPALPKERPATLTTEHYKAIHHLTMEMQTVNGTLTCSKCNSKFQIRDAIPNMMLHEAGDA